MCVALLADVFVPVSQLLIYFLILSHSIFVIPWLFMQVTHTTNTYLPTYIHGHTYTYTYTYKCTYTYFLHFPRCRVRVIHIHAYIHTCIHTYVRTYINTHTRTHTYIYTHLYMPTCIRIYLHIHTYIHTYIHKFSRLRMHVLCMMYMYDMRTHLCSSPVQVCIQLSHPLLYVLTCIPIPGSCMVHAAVRPLPASASGPELLQGRGIQS